MEGLLKSYPEMTQEVLPMPFVLQAGVICHLAKDTHSFGSDWIEVQTATGPYVVAGDCVYWYDNIEQMWPPGYDQGNSWNIIRAYREIRENLDGDIGELFQHTSQNYLNSIEAG